MSIDTEIAFLERESADEQRRLAALRACQRARLPSHRRVPGTGRLSFARAAIEVLKVTGRPVHGTRELLPVLEVLGYTLKHRSGLPTVLMRTGQVERVAPGTFALRRTAAPRRRPRR
jgi:hypothetical protein